MRTIAFKLTWKELYWCSGTTAPPRSNPYGYENYINELSGKVSL